MFIQIVLEDGEIILVNVADVHMIRARRNGTEILVKLPGAAGVKSYQVSHSIIEVIRQIAAHDASRIIPT